MSPVRRSSILMLVALTALAFNLRPAAVSVGPVLDEVRLGLGMSSTTAGIVTTLPVLCFSVFGLAAPSAARRLGIHRAMLLALALTTVGLTVRAGVTSSWAFIAASIAALAGMAAANVLIPSLVKLHFADRLGVVTAVYTTSLSVGLTAASVLTVPMAEATGSWRGGLVLWAGAAFFGVLPWLGLVRHDVSPEAAGRRSFGTRDMLRSRLAWAMAMFFGLQSLQAYSIFGWLPQIYRDAGFSASAAGLLLGVTTGISIPISFVLPAMAGKRHNQAPFIVVLCGSYFVGYIGLIVAPSYLPWLWAATVGIGAGTFPLILTMIGLRARTSDGTAALSGFAQSLGYLVAIAGPFMMGALYGATGGWTWPLVVLTALIVPQTVAGLLVSRERYVEDDLETSRAPALDRSASTS